MLHFNMETQQHLITQLLLAILLYTSVTLLTIYFTYDCQYTTNGN